MKNKFIRVGFLAIFLLSISFAARAQDEAAYRAALAEAAAQSDPSEYRAKALRKYIEAYSTAVPKKSVAEIQEIFLAKFRELAEMDFYAAYRATITIKGYGSAFTTATQRLPPAQHAAVQKLAQWHLARYHAGQQKQAMPAYPAGVPQPGYGWGKSVSSNRANNAANKTASQPAAATTAAAATTTATASKQPAQNQQSAQPPPAPEAAAVVAAYTESLTRGNEHFKAGRLDDAIREYTEAIKLNPQRAVAYKNRGQSYGLKFYGDTRAIKSGTLQLGLGIKVQNNDAELALKDLTKAIELNPRDYYAFFIRAELYSKYYESEKAIADAREGLKLKPDFAEGKKFYDNVVKNYSAVLIAEAKDDETAAERDQNPAGKQAWYEKALRFYGKAIEINENDPLAYGGRGDIYKKLKQYDSALADYSKAIQMRPNDESFYSRRADVYGRQKKFDLVAADLGKAIAIMEKRTVLSSVLAVRYAERGLAYFNNNQLDLALADYEKALQIAPDSAAAFYYRGLLRLKKGQKQAAIDDFKKTLQVNPMYRGAREELDKLGVK